MFTKIAQIIRVLFGIDSPYDRGFRYAMNELMKSSGNEIASLLTQCRLQAESDGTFNRSKSEHEFDAGIRRALDIYRS